MKKKIIHWLKMNFWLLLPKKKEYQVVFPSGYRSGLVWYPTAYELADYWKSEGVWVERVSAEGRVKL